MKLILFFNTNDNWVQRRLGIGIVNFTSGKLLHAKDKKLTNCYFQSHSLKQAIQLKK